ncbi:MAG: MarR family winged helix-turn-helix transcriptional regulator [Alphaproteobacteria bacterium]|nr:MarR family winged helix-turn-helix transcriptional regulator [Alphaproteobacteria bacterium]
MRALADAKSNPDSPVTNQLTHMLHRAGQGGDELFLASIRDHALTPRQFAVLTAAQSRDEPSQATLVADTGIDRSTLADIVGRLEAKGLLDRKRTNHDARAYAISVTEKGERTLADLTPRLADIERKILSPIPPDQQADFVKNLQAIVRKLQNQHQT